MDIRFACEQDKEKLIDIWRYCFNDTEEFISWYFHEKYQEKNTLVAYENNQPISSLQLIPYKLMFHGKEINVSYVVGVDTLPEARGAGYAKGLLAKSLEVMRERGHYISILLPFQYAFYRKYGWETCYYHKHYHIVFDDLRFMAVPYGKLKPINFEKDFEMAADVYRRYTVDKHGYIIRTTEHWKHIFKDLAMEKMKGYFISDGNGNVHGYILYGIKKDTLDIYEMAYVNPAAYRGLLWFVYMHSAQAKHITWKAPADDMTFSVLTDLAHEVSLKPFVMARVIDVERVLAMLSESTPKSLRLDIEVQDMMASWNNGMFRIGNREVTRQEGLQPELTCSINTLSQLVMGFISPWQAYRLGMLNISGIETVKKAEMIFKKKNNFINDYY